ncbi:MAG: hypothetical protein ABIO64_02310 [Burkholderiaceae bacterium]
MAEEVQHLQPVPVSWRANIAAARVQGIAPAEPAPKRPAVVIAHIEQETPAQHPLAVYEQLLDRIVQGAAT